jgi:hypothetical protein
VGCALWVVFDWCGERGSGDLVWCGRRSSWSGVRRFCLVRKVVRIWCPAVGVLSNEYCALPIWLIWSGQLFFEGSG